jgi:cysteine synthase
MIAEAAHTAATGSNIVPIVVALVGSSGIIGGIGMFLKLRPERDSLVVSTAQAALAMQTGITDNLRSELERATERLARIDELETELARCRSDLRLAHARIEALERSSRQP